MQERLRRKKVFDTSLYKDLAPDAAQDSITEDLAGLVLEAGDKPLKERVNPRRFKIIEGQIIDTVTGENIFGRWIPSDKLGKKENTSANLFYQHLQGNSEGAAILNISPSGGISPYKEGRINIGYKETDEDIVFYGIPTKLDPETLRLIAAKALSLLGLRPSFIDSYIPTPDDLRNKAIPVNIPKGEDPWLLLSKILPLDGSIWESIFSGLPWKLKNEARAVAKEAATNARPMIERASSEYDYVHAGAYAERHMERAGFRIDHLGCPGVTNTQLLSDGSYTKDAYGNARATTSGEGKFVHNCGNCGTPIFAVISAGYVCSKCGGTYKGC